jgi:hypothetical protein
MMAPGEIRLSTTTMRRMPVLAQSQAANDGLQEITVTAQSTAQSAFQNGPILVQRPFIDPFLESLRTRPVSPSEFGKTPTYGTETGVPDPLPPPPPQNFWYYFFDLFKQGNKYIDSIFSAPPLIASVQAGDLPLTKINHVKKIDIGIRNAELRKAKSRRSLSYKGKQVADRIVSVESKGGV